MGMLYRTQLTLFIPKPASTLVETARNLLDPIQASLIHAHVTLCREDELGDLDAQELDKKLSTFGAWCAERKFIPTP
jgi:hypothetical protein